MKNLDLAHQVFLDTFDWIEAKVFWEGYIACNTSVGTRGWWYHLKGLNNMLGMVALAEQ